MLVLTQSTHSGQRGHCLFVETVFDFCPRSDDGELPEGVPGRVRHRARQDAADAPDPPRPRAQLLRLLLRNHQLSGPRVSPGETGDLPIYYAIGIRIHTAKIYQKSK